MMSEVSPPSTACTKFFRAPEDWSMQSLRSCLRSAPRYGINAAAVSFDANLPTYLRITDISDDNQFKPSPRVSVRHPDAGKYYLNEGDVVFARTGASVGKSYLYKPSDGALVFAGFLICITPDTSKLEPAFLAYFAQSKEYMNWVSVTSIRSGQPGINGEEYGEMKILLPSCSEQCIIVEVLSNVDRLLRVLESLLVKKRVIKSATMQQLLTGKTRLPGYSDGWKTYRFGETVTFLPTANNPRSDLDENGDFEYIHYGEVHAYERSILRCDEYNFRRIQNNLVGKSAKLLDGDLVMVDASEDLEGIGKSVEIQGVMEREIIAGLHTILCRGISNFWAAGFKAYLQFLPAFRIALTRAATGISVYAVSKKTLAGVEIPLPGRSEQEAIVSVLSAMDAEIAALEKRRDKVRAIKQGMMQQLLTGRIRLPLPPAPADEEEVP